MTILLLKSENRKYNQVRKVQVNTLFTIYANFLISIKFQLITKLFKSILENILLIFLY